MQKIAASEGNRIGIEQYGMELEIRGLNKKPWARLSEIHKCDQTELNLVPYPSVLKLNPAGSVKENEKIILGALEDAHIVLDDRQKGRIAELLERAEKEALVRM
ncbi:MAG: hypothetical protein KGH54_00460 [Candidatus Micrarchaeota archaeon]|nr:hypothetical protein [Candidatus Micrarchaeota archaeon]